MRRCKRYESRIATDSSAEDYYQAGLAALENWSARQDAIALFQQAVELDPEHLDAWYELAKQQRETGDYCSVKP